MKPISSLAQQLALWADQLRDISALGLRFSQTIYDREHYQAIQDMALDMFALTTDTPAAELEPLRSTVLSRPTPFAVGDAAVINEAGEILLIRRADNGRWAMPGGALEVGETPAQGVVREALEETGVRAEAVQLVGVYDSRLCGSVTAHHLYQLVFLCKPLSGGSSEPASHAQEVLDTGWFAEEALPDDLDPGHRGRIPDAFRAWRGKALAYFDR
jgi:mutator protein MutT